MSMKSEGENMGGCCGKGVGLVGGGGGGGV